MEAFIDSLVADKSFKVRLVKDMKKVFDVLANLHCKVIQSLCLDYYLIEVNKGKCWSIKECHFVHHKHFLCTIWQGRQNQSTSKKVWKTATQAEIEEFLKDFLRLLNQSKHTETKVLATISAANSAKSSLFQPILRLVHHGNTATIPKQWIFN